MPTDFNDDPYLDVCQNIKFGRRTEYERSPTLTDTQCMFSIDSAKVAVKQSFVSAKSQSLKVRSGTEGVVGWCADVGRKRVGALSDLTLTEDIAHAEKIKRSGKRRSAAGPWGYYEFLRDYSERLDSNTQP